MDAIDSRIEQGVKFGYGPVLIEDQLQAKSHRASVSNKKAMRPDEPGIHGEHCCKFTALPSAGSNRFRFQGSVLSPSRDTPSANARILAQLSMKTSYAFLLIRKPKGSQAA
jgi:hypothetical protein